MVDSLLTSNRVKTSRLGRTIVLGAIAVVSDDPKRRKDALTEGEDVLAGGHCIAHNHFWFYREAIDSALADGDWDNAERYAGALEAFTEAERLPWADLHIERGRRIAALGRDPGNIQARKDLRALRDLASAAGQLAVAAEMAEIMQD